MADAQNPLTEEDFRRLKEQLGELDRVDSLISQAERGGIDMGPQKVQARDQRLQINKLIQAFFPGKL